jgi:NAD(P)-dependent dehydrogenase (short-subunit alcohol dehydrogenase family)
MRSLPDGFCALVIGAGGIGRALHAALAADPRCGRAILGGRGQAPSMDLTGIELENEASIRAAAASLGPGPLHLIVVASGALTLDGMGPEKRLADLDPARLARAFAVNAIGPALLIKHFSALLPREGRSIFATLSARVGSIGDNRLGGWYGYRASKAALNQILRTAAIEVARKRPAAILLALHPGTVRTSLTQPFIGEAGAAPAEAASHLLAVMDAATESGMFLDQNGKIIPW